VWDNGLLDIFTLFGYISRAEETWLIQNLMTVDTPLLICILLSFGAGVLFLAVGCRLRQLYPLNALGAGRL